MEQPEHPIGHLFREAYGEIVAVLISKFGMSLLDDIEDAVQDGLLRAMQQWGYGRMPDRPRAWLYTVARNRLIDRLRQSGRISDADPDQLRLWKEVADEPPDRVPDNRVIADNQLRMIFACCHPKLKPRQQVLLSLKLVAGFSNAEVGRALLQREGTVSRAYTRSKEILKGVLNTLEATHALGLRSRISIVQRVLYVLFTEGYQPTQGDRLLKRDMCREAIRLALLLHANPYFANPETDALLALMCFHCARFDARLDAEGRIVDLEHQDRSRYNRELIEIGKGHLNAAHSGPGAPSRYHLEAGVSYLHCAAPDFNATDWPAILLLYDAQLERQYSPMTALNRLVPLAFKAGPGRALSEHNQLVSGNPDLDAHPLTHAVLGMICRQSGQHEASAAAYKRAAALTKNKLEKSHYLRMAKEHQARSQPFR